MSTFQSENLPAGRGIKPLVSLRAHRTLAAAVWCLLMLLAVPAAWIKGSPVYSSQASIHVSPRFMKNLKEDMELQIQSNQQYREFVQQNVTSVQRIDILMGAIEAMGDNQWVWRGRDESLRRAADRLSDRLVVRSVPDTYLISISLSAGKPDGLADVVNAIAAHYLEVSQREGFFGAGQRLSSLDKRAIDLRGEVSALVERRTAISKELGVAAFNDRDPSPYDKSITAQREALAHATQARAEAQARLNTFQTKDAGDAAMPTVHEAVADDAGLTALKTGLYQRRASLLAMISGLTENHPAWKGAQKEIDDIDTTVRIATEKVTTAVRTAQRMKLEAAVQNTTQVEQAIAAALENIRKNSAGYATLYGEALAINDRVELLNKELNEIRDRVNFIRMESDAPGFLRLAAAGLPPDRPSSGGRTKLLIVFLLGATFVALALPLGIDLLDPRVHSPNELQRLIGVEPMSWLVDTDDADSQAFRADQLRRFATTLERQRRDHGAQAFLFSSVKTGAGVSRTVNDLAETLVALGLPTLIIDANAFVTDSKVQGEPTPGLFDLLDGKAGVDEIVTHPAGAHAARIGLGNANGRRHLERYDIIEVLLQRLLGEYAFVLIDAPPILLSSDVELLLSKVGQAVIVVEAGGVVRGEILRAVRQIDKARPKAAGFILNRVRGFEGGGYIRGLIDEYTHGRRPPTTSWLSPQNLRSLQTETLARLSAVVQRFSPRPRP